MIYSDRDLFLVHELFYISLNAVKTKVIPNIVPAIALLEKMTAAYEAMGHADER